jgi:hypothetical protein
MSTLRLHRAEPEPGAAGGAGECSSTTWPISGRWSSRRPPPGQMSMWVCRANSTSALGPLFEPNVDLDPVAGCRVREKSRITSQMSISFLRRLSRSRFGPDPDAPEGPSIDSHGDPCPLRRRLFVPPIPSPRPAAQSPAEVLGKRVLTIANGSLIPGPGPGAAPARSQRR